jgi:hypothetical protein
LLVNSSVIKRSNLAWQADNACRDWKNAVWNMRAASARIALAAAVKQARGYNRMLRKSTHGGNTLHTWQ